jgi:hypothetical protein
MKHVYVAGPFTQGVVEVNVRKAVNAGDRLLSAGLVPYVPHLNWLWGFAHERTYEEWLALDMAWLGKCDAVLRLPGHSPGADREEAFAREHGIPVFYHESRLLEWAFHGGPV